MRHIFLCQTLFFHIRRMKTFWSMFSVSRSNRNGLEFPRRFQNLQGGSRIYNIIYIGKYFLVNVCFFHKHRAPTTCNRGLFGRHVDLRRTALVFGTLLILKYHMLFYIPSSLPEHQSGAAAVLFTPWVWPVSWRWHVAGPQRCPRGWQQLSPPPLDNRHVYRNNTASTRSVTTAKYGYYTVDL